VLKLIGTEISALPKSIDHLQSLTFLDISYSSVSGEDILSAAKTLKNLKRLYIYECPFVEEYIDLIKEELPNCGIIWSMEQMSNFVRSIDKDSSRLRVTKANYEMVFESKEIRDKYINSLPTYIIQDFGISTVSN